MPHTARFLVSLLLTAALLAATGCVTDNTGPSKDSFMSRMKDRPPETAAKDSGAAAKKNRAQPAAGGTEEAAPPRAAPAPAMPDYPDTRVMFYQPKGDLLLILVNETNTSRATEAGRIALSLGEGNRAYKVIGNAQMDALLKSLASKGYDVNASDFVQGDEQYLAKSSADLARYQGIISVEHGSVKTKLLGFRRSSEGDALGLRRYQAYTVLKGLVQTWFGDSSNSEFPVGGVTIQPGKGDR